MAFQFADRMRGVRPSAIRDLLKFGADPELISFGGGYPDPSLFPVEGLRVVFDEVLSGDRRVLQYAQSDGDPRLRAQVAARLNRDGIDCTAADLLIVQGAQQGLDLVGRLLLDPGDVVVTEDPTFIGALVAFNAYQAAYAPVRTDADGMDMADLERVLAANPRAKVIYTIPDFQNPTGVTLSLERRVRLMELARRFDVLVLEDSPYRQLRFDGDDVPTLASLDTDGRVVHLGSFSKILSPGMRLGWALARGRVREGLLLLKLAADTQCSTLNMAAASAFMERYDLDEHIRGLRAAYKRKRDLMIETLGESFPPSVTFTNPEGGLFTWLTFPAGFDATAFLVEQAVPKAHVAFVPGAPFYPVPATAEANHARLNYSGASDERIVTGLGRLADLLRHQLPG